MSDDSVLLDIGFAHIPNDEIFAQRLWSNLDEQVLPPDVRRRLAANGLRVGIVGNQLPDLIRNHLHNSSSADSSKSNAPLVDSESPTNLDLGENNRKIQLRSGKRGEIVTSDICEQLVVLCQEAGHTCGETFRDAQTLLAVEAFGNGDGSATLRLTPEIQHGQSKQKFVGSDGAFHRQSQRELRAFNEMQIELEMSPGQTFAVTSAGPGKSLGGSFFSAPAGDANQKKLLLVRLARSPGDQLFASDSGVFDDLATE